MITRTGYNQSNNVSFGGITKIKAVLFNEAVTYDKDLIDRAIRIAKKIYMKRNDTPQHDAFAKSIRNALHYFDRDYTIPTVPVKGDTRDFFTHVRAGHTHFFASGKDAEVFSKAGYKIGQTKKAARLAQGTEKEMEKAFEHDIAVSEYGGDILDIQEKYANSPYHTEMAIFLNKGQNGKVGVSSIIVGNDAHKLDIQKQINYIKAQKAKLEAERLAKLKKNPQTDFMDKLFPTNKA